MIFCITGYDDQESSVEMEYETDSSYTDCSDTDSGKFKRNQLRVKKF